MHTRARNVVLVLLGVTALVLKGHYSGPYETIVRSCGFRKF